MMFFRSLLMILSSFFLIKEYLSIRMIKDTKSILVRKLLFQFLINRFLFFEKKDWILLKIMGFLD